MTGRRTDTKTGVLELEVLIGELGAIDTLASRAVASGEVTTLDHKVGDDAVEGRTLVAEAELGSIGRLAGRERTEVFDRLGNGATYDARGREVEGNQAAE